MQENKRGRDKNGGLIGPLLIIKGDLMKMKNKGSMGVGTLIIFIAVILVAAVAAAVLISTAGSLQQRALVTGGQTEQAVATGAEAVSVTASNASVDHEVESFEMIIRLQAGSEALNLNTTVVMLDTSTGAWNLDYSGSSAFDVSSTTGTYGADYVKMGPDYEAGYLARGDVLKLKFNMSAALGENKKVRIRLIPRVGSATVVDFTTPDVMTDNRISLWP
jgi:archaeal flagellin FlaB